MYEVASLNNGLVTDYYYAPTNALTLGTQLKYIGEILIVEYIKPCQLEKKKNFENFSKLYEGGFGYDVNKTAMETLIRNR